jgi:hypothetical protein
MAFGGTRVVDPNRVEFFLDDHVVGYFELELPLRIGKHPYVPYRGYGHLTSFRH